MIAAYVWGDDGSAMPTSQSRLPAEETIELPPRLIKAEDTSHRLSTSAARAAAYPFASPPKSIAMPAPVNRTVCAAASTQILSAPTEFGDQPRACTNGPTVT